MAMSPINRALNLVPKRAESREAKELHETFVDNGVAAVLDVVDHQVLYGRRGTGKTHAIRFLESKSGESGEIALYFDLRTVGSPEGLIGGVPPPATERAARLLVDLLGQVHDRLVEIAVESDDLIEDKNFLSKLDAFAESITKVAISGDVERLVEGEEKAGSTSEAEVGASLGAVPKVDAKASVGASREARAAARETRRGTERISLNFSEVAKALRELADSLKGRRVWLFLDEWTSVPIEVQPYLAEFLVRCVLPLQGFTVKIGAIEQQSNFRAQLQSGDTIGIELGADVSANLDLDEFMVFEQNEDRARTFFLDLFFKHLTLGTDEEEQVPELQKENDLIKHAFTDKRAFEELVRAAEGVPRDAIHIAGKAAYLAGERKISVDDVRAAARGWFQQAKDSALNSNPKAKALLNWAIDEVIKEKRARGFLVNQRVANDSLIMALFEARVLHLVRQGYSAQDDPGERYNVYVIDYGAYVDLIHTKYEPQGVLPTEDADTFVDVPTQDLRALRRAILDLDAFEASYEAAGQDGKSPVEVSEEALEGAVAASADGPEDMPAKG